MQENYPETIGFIIVKFKRTGSFLIFIKKSIINIFSY